MTDSYQLAQSFSVGSDGGNYTLTSGSRCSSAISDISSTDIGSLGVSVWSADASGDPESSLHTLTNPASIAENVAASFTAPAGATLEAGNTYFVVAYNDRDLSVGPDWRGTNSDDQDATSIAGWTLANNGLRRAPADTGWSGRTYAFNLRVNGTAVGGTTSGICDRTAKIQEVILAEISGVDNCAAVTDANLAAITELGAGGLALLNQGITTLQKGDFAGLTSLTKINLFGNSLTSLPEGIFDGLTALIILSLASNQLDSLPEGAFDGLVKLNTLALTSNNLTGVRAGAFSDLTLLDELDLDRNDLASLDAGVFSSLTALTILRLHNNALSSLPDGVFSGLTALTTLTLQDNSTNPMQLTVTVEKVGTNQVRARVLAGAPFAVDIPVTLVDGTLEGSVTVLGVAAGRGGQHGAHRDPHDRDDGGRDRGRRPDDPSDAAHGSLGLHLRQGGHGPAGDHPAGGGRVVGRDAERSGRQRRHHRPDADADLRIGHVHLHGLGGEHRRRGDGDADEERFRGDDRISGRVRHDAHRRRHLGSGHQVALAEGETVIKVKVTAEDGNATQTYMVTVTRAAAMTGGICDRTVKIQEVILAEISGVDNCAAVTDANLAAITTLGAFGLSTSNQGITSLQKGDFAGLTSLTLLNLSQNSLPSLPEGIFAGLGELTELSLTANQLESLPEGAFSDLTALTILYLSSNNLSSLDAGLFSVMTALKISF